MAVAPAEIARVSSDEGRRSYARIVDVLPMPNLNQVQIESFDWFKKEGLRELLEEISPILDFTGHKLELRFTGYEFGEPKYSEDECRLRDMTYSVPLNVDVEMVRKDTGEVIQQRIFMGDFPLMTPNGTFVINGAERVVVSQLVRSPGVYFNTVEDATTGRNLCLGKLIPNRGAWLEFETSNKDVVSVKVDRKRKVTVTTVLRAFFEAAGDPHASDDDLLGIFADVESAAEHQYIRATLERDPSRNGREALIEFYRRMRPGDPPTEENARGLVISLFFNPRRYDLGRVGRYKLNKRLRRDPSRKERVLTKEDLIEIVREMVRINNGEGTVDDIDHLGNRRVRSVGELIQNQFRVGLLRMERVAKERMSIQDPETAIPTALVNMRPVFAAMREFFGGSQLSQFMDQTNPLAELTHKRRLSALGPGGLSRERAGFDVRDVHHSHYGRICPIETPEGPNIGLIGSLASYGVINEYGFIETPYRRVTHQVENTVEALVGRRLGETIFDSSGAVVAEAGTRLERPLAERVAALPRRMVVMAPFVTDEIEYLSADREELFIIAQANSELNEYNELIEEKVEVRHGERFTMESPLKVDYMDVCPRQIVSVATALIPFLEHDDANRALMGSNMQRQAVPLLRPEAPLIGTGMERQTALDSGQVVMAEEEGVVASCTARAIVVANEEGRSRRYDLIKFRRSNQGTCIDQRPVVSKGERVRAGQVLADSSSTDRGELALGQNVLCAFMSWEGGNFEDAVVLSSEVVRQDKFTSIHIEKHEVASRDTKLGAEEITRDIPNVGEESLRDLDEHGIIRIGAEVGPGDILVGKITPKGETELTPEERLLRAIFGEKAREVKDTSLRVPHGERGKVVDVRVFSRANRDELPSGVNELVRVCVAQKRKIAEGDKMAGRHGNKGVISRILPPEDMPLLPDGTPVEIILNPIGVPSRMNVGQVLETHLGWAASMLDLRVTSPVFDGAREASIEDALARAWIYASALRANGGSLAVELHAGRPDEGFVRDWLLQQGYQPPEAERILGGSAGDGYAKRACLELWLREHGEPPEGLLDAELQSRAEEVSRRTREPLPVLGKIYLRDGCTGEYFDQPVTVGYIYLMKLIHLVESKIHARSTGPYSLITQQPLGGKAQFGGQRFGEMEVWALEAYGAAHILQEMLTVKSDDVVGRVKTYEAIVKGEDLLEPGVPESFKVLVKELQSLGLAVEVLNEEEEEITFQEDVGGDVIPEFGISLTGFEKA